MMHTTGPVDELLSVVAEPTRARIVAELARESLCTCHLVEILGAGRTAVSNKLRVLRSAGVGRLSRDDTGPQLLQNSTATALGLTLALALYPVRSPA